MPENTALAAFDSNVLAPEDARMVEEAQALGDTNFIAKMRELRQEMIILLANTSLTRRDTSTKFIAKHFSVTEKMVKRMRSSYGFKNELNAFIRERVLKDGAGLHLEDARRKHIEAIKKGHAWAIQLEYKMAGLLEKPGEESKQKVEDVI